MHCCGVSDADIISDYHRSNGVAQSALGGGRIERGAAIDKSRRGLRFKGFKGFQGLGFRIQGSGFRVQGSGFQF